MFGLTPFEGGVRALDDSGAGVEVGGALVDIGAAQQDPELPAEVGLDDARRAGVPAPFEGFPIAKPGVRLPARLAVGGRGRVKAFGQGEDVHRAIKPGADAGPEVVDVGEAHDAWFRRDFDGRRDLGQGLPDGLDHQAVFVAVLGGVEQGLGQGPVASRRGGAGRGPGQGVHLQPMAPQTEQAFGRRGDETAVTLVEAEDLAGGVAVRQAGQQPVDVEGAVALNPPPAGEDDFLEALAGDLS